MVFPEFYCGQIMKEERKMLFSKPRPTTFRGWHLLNESFEVHFEWFFARLTDKPRITLVIFHR